MPPPLPPSVRAQGAGRAGYKADPPSSYTIEIPGTGGADAPTRRGNHAEYCIVVRDDVGGETVKRWRRYREVATVLDEVRAQCRAVPPPPRKRRFSRINSGARYEGGLLDLRARELEACVRAAAAAAAAGGVPPALRATVDALIGADVLRARRAHLRVLREATEVAALGVVWRKLRQFARQRRYARSSILQPCGTPSGGARRSPIPAAGAPLVVIDLGVADESPPASPRTLLRRFDIRVPPPGERHGPERRGDHAEYCVELRWADGSDAVWSWRRYREFASLMLQVRAALPDVPPPPPKRVVGGKFAQSLLAARAVQMQRCLRAAARSAGLAGGSTSGDVVCSALLRFIGADTLRARRQLQRARERLAGTARRRAAWRKLVDHAWLRRCERDPAQARAVRVAEAAAAAAAAAGSTAVFAAVEELFRVSRGASLPSLNPTASRESCQQQSTNPSMVPTVPAAGSFHSVPPLQAVAAAAAAGAYLLPAAARGARAPAAGGGTPRQWRLHRPPAIRTPRDAAGAGRAELDSLQQLLHHIGAELKYAGCSGKEECPQPELPPPRPQPTWRGPHRRAGHGAGAALPRRWRAARRVDVQLHESGILRTRSREGDAVWVPVTAVACHGDAKKYTVRVDRGPRSGTVWRDVPLAALQRQWEVMAVPAVDVEEVGFVDADGDDVVFAPAGAGGAGVRYSLHRAGGEVEEVRGVAMEVWWRPEWGDEGQPGWIDMPDIEKRIPVPRADLPMVLAGLRCIARRGGCDTNIGATAFCAMGRDALRAPLSPGGTKRSARSLSPRMRRAEAALGKPFATSPTLRRRPPASPPWASRRAASARAAPDYAWRPAAGGVLPTPADEAPGAATAAAPPGEAGAGPGQTMSTLAPLPMRELGTTVLSQNSPNSPNSPNSVDPKLTDPSLGPSLGPPPGEETATEDQLEATVTQLENSSWTACGSKKLVDAPKLSADGPSFPIPAIHTCTEEFSDDVISSPTVSPVHSAGGGRGRSPALWQARQRQYTDGSTASPSLGPPCPSPSQSPPGSGAEMRRASAASL